VLYIRLTLLLGLFSALVFQQLPGNIHKEATKKPQCMEEHFYGLFEKEIRSKIIKR